MAEADRITYRCAGPNCGQLKGEANRWWLMWTAQQDGFPRLVLCEWNEELAQKEGALHVCGEGCAQKLQSVFMSNILDNRDQARRR